MDPVILPQKKKKAQLELNHDGTAGKKRDILQQNWLEIFKILKGEGRKGRMRGWSRLWRIHITHISAWSICAMGQKGRVKLKWCLGMNGNHVP